MNCLKIIFGILLGIALLIGLIGTIDDVTSRCKIKTIASLNDPVLNEILAQDALNKNVCATEHNDEISFIIENSTFVLLSQSLKSGGNIRETAVILNISYFDERLFKEKYTIPLKCGASASYGLGVGGIGNGELIITTENNSRILSLHGWRGGDYPAWDEILNQTAFNVNSPCI